MTDREKAIVMAHTGFTMLAGEKFSIFHKYIEDLLGRPIWTHELANEAVWNEIKEKSKPDFLDLCKTEDKSCNDRTQGEWISPKESLPRTTDKTKKYATVGAIDLQESDEVLCYLKPYCKMNSLDTDDRFIVARYVREKNESCGYQTYWYASGDDGSFDIEDVIAWSYINKDELNIEEVENEC